MLYRMNTWKENLLPGVPHLVTIDETAELLHLQRRSVARYISLGLLKTTKLVRGRGTSGRRLILRTSIVDLIAAGMDDQP
jgi:hypothetical protein